MAVQGKQFVKFIDESSPISKKNGGGVLRTTAWKDKDGNIVKYNISYINPSICAADNGRVLGYDNSHGYHHRHYWGEIVEINDFVSFENLVKRFMQEIQEFITW